VRDSSAYEWRQFTECNMCGAGVGRARTLGRRLDHHQGWRPARDPGGLSAGVQRCGACGLVFANPMPLPLDLDHHYGMAAEDYWPESELFGRDEYFADQILQFRRLYPRRDRLTALDIGAGAGKAMASLEAAGFTTFGLEPSASFRQHAISVSGIAAERLSLGGIAEATFPEGEFDLVTFGAVLEHLPDPASAILSALRWARPGGLIHVEVPSSDWLMARLVDFAYRVQRLERTCHLSPLHIPFHLFEFTPRSFELHALRAGYEIAACLRHVGRTYAPDWADRVLVSLMEVSGTGLQLEVWLRKPV
jgi:SAM-dependent methyltransferase